MSGYEPGPLVSPTVDQGFPSSYFIPGAVVAASPYAVIPNNTVSGKSLLTYIEGNLKAAPTGASPAAAIQVQVQGDVSGGPVTIALDGSGSNNGRVYAQRIVNAQVASQKAAGSSFNTNVTGMLSTFRVSSGVTVTAIAFDADPANRNPVGIQRVYELYDTNLNLIGQTAPYYGPMGNTLTGAVPVFSWPVPLIAPVALAAATTYYVGWRAPNSYTSDVAGRISTLATANPTYTYSGNLTATRPLAASGFNFVLAGVTSLPKPWDWQGVLANVGTQASLTDNTQSRQANFALYTGSPGLIIAGNALINLVQAGVPTTPGSDLNLRMAWQTQS